VLWYLIAQNDFFFKNSMSKVIGLPLNYLAPLVFGMFTLSSASFSFVFCQEDKGVL
jgi:hypothetical protein